MNANRRDQIRKITKVLETTKDLLQNVLDEEKDVFDNMSENLQGSMRGMDSEEAIDLMTEAVESIENVTNLLEGI